MTIGGGFRPASRRSGLLGVHSIGEFVLSVPDVSDAEKFYGAFGFDTRAANNQLALHTAADGYRWGRVIGGGRKAMHHVSFHCFEEDLARFKTHLEAHGVKVLDPPPGFDSNGLWFYDHDGMLLEIKVGVKTSPNEKAPMEAPAPATPIRTAPNRGAVRRTQPRRLSHIVRFTPDVDRAVAFYSRVLGLRLSDRSADAVAFMHGVHGSDHHLMAFGKSDAPGLHHLSWDVPSIDSVGLGAMQMADKGFSRGWGLGRHVLGSNYFHYVRDPWGSYCEYSCDMDIIPAAIDWQGLDHAPEDSFYLWGPNVPEDFGVNHEAAGA
ncbi:VOC family protein [Methylocapsa sp. S129]|uniref:VOC family protein n=1 Tax=Methylocapsa sp. S129 TaxID=1641869 RepID=UPI00131BFD96|nr:VOC family protein [Methylocapsa sp. S129]